MENTPSSIAILFAPKKATVKKALEAIDGVAEAKVSHDANEAVVTLNADVPDDVLTKAVVDAGYEVAGIQ